ncbi:MAG: dTDP-4-dehydrorhamnose 3,5-epimerase [Bdellovibrionales bacterium]|nr:dTDP-4-dehydrorhamnose 3,5-epimerase [Bdellovibrionales bacterium]
MKIHATALPGLFLIEPKLLEDNRGFFAEVSKKSTFQRAGIPSEFVQENVSLSNKGVTRGFHFQKFPHAQGKLIRCARGAIYDVVIDLRPESKTFAQSLGFLLDDRRHLSLWIPPGFAQGFQALENDSLVVYKCTAEYSASHEAGVHLSDPSLQIRWPLPLEASKMSPKDLALPYLEDLQRLQNFQEASL